MTTTGNDGKLNKLTEKYKFISSNNLYVKDDYDLDLLRKKKRCPYDYMADFS